MVSRAVLSTILPLLLREEYPLFIYNGYRYVSIRPGYEPRPVGCLSVDPAFLADQHPNILGREPLRVTLPENSDTRVILRPPQPVSNMALLTA